MILQILQYIKATPPPLIIPFYSPDLCQENKIKEQYYSAVLER